MWHTIHVEHLADIFSSRTRTEILTALAEQSRPIHLRALAELCTVKIRAVQEALEALCKEEVLKREKDGARVLFSLNPAHQTYGLILEVSRSAKEHFLKERAKRYSAKAQGALDFASDAHELFAEARRRRHTT